ncbi:MAG: hypothetical protein IJR15_00020 [Clostridiales bacterium]|nr:hypothetical protein [Clostridiales bacterium]
MKKESNNNRRGKPVVIAVCVTVLLALTAAVILLAIRWYRFQKYINTTSKFYDKYGNVPEEVMDFADYCSSNASGSFQTVFYDTEGAYISVIDVDSMYESNEVILAMNDFFGENPDYILNHRSLKIIMSGDDFYIEYYWDTPSDSIREIRTVSFYIPKEASNEDYIDVQRICIVSGNSLSEERIAILETMYPNAEIVLE